jgi:hypothetical protein
LIVASVSIINCLHSEGAEFALATLQTFADEDQAAPQSVASKLIFIYSNSKISLPFCKDCKIFCEGVNAATAKSNSLFGHSLAFGLTMAFGLIMAFCRNLTFGLIMAFRHNVAFGLTMALPLASSALAYLPWQLFDSLSLLALAPLFQSMASLASASASLAASLALWVLALSASAG